VLFETAKTRIDKQRRSRCASATAKQLLDAKGKATAQAAARQQQHRYVITSYKQAMYSTKQLLMLRGSELKKRQELLSY